MLQSLEIPGAHEPVSPAEITVIEERVKEQLEAAMSFDPVSWACTSFHPASPHENLEKRIRMASAHRAAVCLFVARVLPNNSALLDPSSPTMFIYPAALATEIVYQLSDVNPGDAVFKSISWALFLAGAESEIPTERAWIVQKLYTLWRELYWGYVRTVMEVLQYIWSFKDREARGVDVCWVDEIKRLGTELLIA